MEMRVKNWDSSLYGIIDTGYLSEDEFQPALKELASGGVGIIQFRAKGWEKDKVLHWCLRLAPLAKALGVAFIVNDFVDIALACEADGVHVGQDDGSLDEVRSQMGEGKIIGRSTHSYDQAVQAYRDGADYIGFGPLFPTMTKPGRPAIGLDDISRVHEDLPVDFPIYCIGGVQPDRLDIIKAAGARRVVIVSWILQHEDRTQAALSIKETME